MGITIFIRFGAATIRLVERHCPIFFIYVILWPAAALAACGLNPKWNVGATIRDLRRLPEALRSSVPGWRWYWVVWSGRVALCMTHSLRFIPDRLRDARWQARCRIEGLDRPNDALAAGRPVILVTLHYGNLTELYHWLRARGMCVAFLADRELAQVPKYRAVLNSMADRVNGLDGVPRFFPTDQLWEARDFLSSPGRLLGRRDRGQSVSSEHPGEGSRILGPAGSRGLAPGRDRRRRGHSLPHQFAGRPSYADPIRLERPGGVSRGPRRACPGMRAHPPGTGSLDRRATGAMRIETPLGDHAGNHDGSATRVEIRDLTPAGWMTCRTGSRSFNPPPPSTSSSDGRRCRGSSRRGRRRSSVHLLGCRRL